MELLDLAKDLISIESISGNEAKACSYVFDLLSDAGMDPQKIRSGNAFDIFCKASEKGIMFSGHIDTVPYDIDLWKTDPLIPSVEGNKLYGLGSSDMKSGLASLLMAFIRESEGSFLMTVEEETGFAGARSFLDYANENPVVVIGEPTENKLCVEQNGFVFGKGVFRGKNAHTAEYEKGENAIYAAIGGINSLRADFEAKKASYTTDLGTRAALSINMIAGGKTNNQVPDYCDFVVDRRISPRENKEEVRERISGILEKAGGAYEHKMSKDPLLVDGDVVRRLGVGGLEKSGLGGFTEAGIFSERGMKSVILGPGRMDMAHCPNEYVEIDKLNESFRIYSGILRSFGQKAF